MNSKTAFFALALSCVAGSASATELVTDGNFETVDSNGYYGKGWNVDANFDYSGDRSYFFDQWGDVAGYFSGASASLSYFSGDDVAISQTVNTAGYSSAVLSFSFLSDTFDPIGAGDSFTVTFGGHVLDAFDVGGDGNGYHDTLSYDLTPYLTGGLQTLELRGTNSDSGDGTGTYVDNVSINARAVPEPASMAALGLGALALLRRRRR